MALHFWFSDFWCDKSGKRAGSKKEGSDGGGGNWGFAGNLPLPPPSHSLFGVRISKYNNSYYLSSLNTNSQIISLFVHNNWLESQVE